MLVGNAKLYLFACAGLFEATLVKPQLRPLLENWASALEKVQLSFSQPASIDPDQATHSRTLPSVYTVFDTTR